MEFFKNFFRGTEDGFVFDLFGPVHIALLAFFIIGIIFIVTKKFGLDKPEKNKKSLSTMAIILLIDQLVLYAWQFGSGYFSMDMSLPLYHCRLVVWILALGILLNNRIMKIIGLYIGFLGSLMAMILADLYQFSFPHYTNFQFFIVHILMGWIVADFLAVEKIYVSKKELRLTLIAINVFNIFLLIFNLLLRPIYKEINYGYILGMPSTMGEVFPKGWHTPILFLLFNLVIYLLYKLFNYFNKDYDSMCNPRCTNRYSSCYYLV